MLWISRYTQKETYNFIKGATFRHSQMREEVENGVRQSMFRKKEEILRAKEAKGGHTASTWFLKGEVVSTISCQATPGSLLVNKLQQKLGTTSEGKKRIVLEEGGEPVTIGLKRKNPFSTNGCKFGDNQCIVSPSSDCSAMGATYIIRCLSCKQTVDPTLKENPKLPGQVRSAHYIGMTACSIHNRMDAHRNGHQQKKERNPLHRHDCESHNGEIQSYQTELVQMDRGLLLI